MSEGSADPTIVFFSGSCRNNGLVDGAAGSGVWWGTEQPKNLAIRTPGKQTNNCSELFGLLSVLEQIRRDDLENANNSDAFLINTDRKYTFDCFTKYLPNWRVNNFSKPSGKGSIQNVELIRYIAALLEYVSLRHDVKLALVSSSENRQARLLAEQAVNLEKVQEVVWSDCRKEVEKKLALAREEIKHKKAQMGREAFNKEEEAPESSKKRKKETKKKKVAQEVSVIAPDKADEGQGGRPKKDKKLKRKAKDMDVGQQQEVVIRVEEERPKKRTKRKYDAEETELEIESNPARPPKPEKKKRSKKAAKVVVVLKIQVETKEKKHRRKEGREGKRRRHDQTE
ncbi:ribonuclease H-like domain-containing protein [Desarmillaria tabescens]|uniref:ribonuclease H n=1 Tax=Armillaria tabescens TaxID=1929756 RepID=A0AA39NIL3_ARMTA|nr:ribonuclease H-like domain-containing protein [Desarmillaria tabescens]KAK0466327.1 ribonuclease H-like domain-containing protein [Desarmillaria tabescens]